jgi:hypothetical protein
MLARQDWRRRDCSGFDGHLLSFGCLLPLRRLTEGCCRCFRGEKVGLLLGVSMAWLPSTFSIRSMGQAKIRCLYKAIMSLALSRFLRMQTAAEN